MKTRKELMQKLNELLGTDFNWSRISKLDLERIALAIQKLIAKIYIQNARQKLLP